MDNCPACQKSWVGEPIPDSIRQYYDGSNYKLEIGIDGGYLGIYDGLVAVVCPFCGGEFAVDSSVRAARLLEEYQKRSNNAYPTGDN